MVRLRTSASYHRQIYPDFSSFILLPLLVIAGTILVLMAEEGFTSPTRFTGPVSLARAHTTASSASAHVQGFQPHFLSYHFALPPRPSCLRPRVSSYPTSPRRLSSFAKHDSISNTNKPHKIHSSFFRNAIAVAATFAAVGPLTRHSHPHYYIATTTRKR
ncbi:hypothetical protein D9758_012666 [Tetrapyrgos nigripes]|uniref:Uncharacterized protein n=1 Tax=Tetrapyrgos nigripes TaxID=182062 RepID=A0A8H5GDR5_9AGAR|nr:hypothetical protein D9758_012666 [Tetrapyrgos nigripes]